MKNRGKFGIAVLVLVANLILALPVAAEAGTPGFTVDCTGAYGFGDVPAGSTYEYRVRFYDPGTNSGTGFVTDTFWQGTVAGPAAFDPSVIWPITPSAGSTSDDSYYWWEIWDQQTGDIARGEGHFTCEAPPPPPPPPPAAEGCTPGFWQGRNNGRLLWDQLPDPDFDPANANPYYTGTAFNAYFTPVGSLNGLTMLDLVGTGGGPNDARKAARSLVAAYLNASYAGINYPYTTADLMNMWNSAVANGTFGSLHSDLDAANNLGCYID